MPGSKALLAADHDDVHVFTRINRDPCIVGQGLIFLWPKIRLSVHRLTLEDSLKEFRVVRFACSDGMSRK